MHIITFLVASLLLAALHCPAAEPASQPAALQASPSVTHRNNVWIAAILWTNPTDQPHSLGRYTSYSVVRTDVHPPITVAATPPHTMSPHFRTLFPPHASQTTTLTLYDQPKPLPPGTYHLSITYPRDILPDPLQLDFTVPAPAPATTAPSTP